jgi:hypothetical protein
MDQARAGASRPRSPELLSGRSSHQFGRRSPTSRQPRASPQPAESTRWDGCHVGGNEPDVIVDVRGKGSKDEPCVALANDSPHGDHG